MQKPHGYVTIVSDGPLVERDSVTCGHCQRIVLVKPGTAGTVYLIRQLDGSPDVEVEGAGCMVCARNGLATPVCLRCHRIGKCIPWERRVEQAEARGRFLRSAGLG